MEIELPVEPWVVVAVVLGIVVIGGAMWLAAWATKSELRRTTSAWMDVAQRRGGRYLAGETNGSGWKRAHAMEVAIGPVLVHAELDGALGSDRGWTVMRAAFARGAGPRFEVSTKPLVPTGAIDLPGHPAFSGHFMIRTPDSPDVVGAVWSPRARDLAMVLSTGNPMEVASNGQTISLRWQSQMYEARYVEAAVDLVAELARPAA